MDAYTHIFVGYRKSLFKKLPADVRGRFDEECEVELDGLIVERYSWGEDEAGFGVQLFEHGFCDKPKKIDLASLADKAAALKLCVAATFKKFGFDKDPELLIVMDMPL